MAVVSALFQSATGRVPKTGCFQVSLLSSPQLKVSYALAPNSILHMFPFHTFPSGEIRYWLIYSLSWNTEFGLVVLPF